MYGMRVHEAVVASGDRETGITIHEVTTDYDDGPVIFKAACEVRPDDSPDVVAGRVHHLEHIHYPRVIEKWINNT
jgi:phosphoribosylglycinamide formyltransferase-1